MIKKKPKIIVFSSFSEDIISYTDLNEVVTKQGGPAFWISKTFTNLGTDFSMKTPETKFQIAITVDKISGEKGEIKSGTEEIQIDKKLSADYFIISTIAEEFSLTTVDLLDGFISIDIQGYARIASAQNRLVYIPKTLWSKIQVLKTTESELKFIDPKFIEDQKNRTLIITKGAEGVEIVSRGIKNNYAVNAVESIDTVGAGDVFLSSFINHISLENKVGDAADFAIKYTANFLHNKI